MLFKRTESFLVCVQSSWFVGEADVARLVLCERGIPCHIENEHFHMWQWLYANISGGFKVQVPREHAEEAARILENGKTTCTLEGDGEPWQCPQCGWTVDGGWDVCWSCTTTRDGVPNRSPCESPADDLSSGTVNDETDSAQRRATAVALLLVILFWATSGSIGAAVIGAAVALMVGCLRDQARLPTVAPPSGNTLEAERRAMAFCPTPAEQSYQRRVRMGNHVVERALCAAVFGFAWFPPLLILTAALLWRLDQKKTPLGPRRRQQARLAWCLCAIGLLLLLPFCAIAITQVATDAVGLMGEWQHP